jgi:hypothetical protein
MMISGIPHLWKPLSFTSPDGKRGMAIMVAFPENDLSADPVYLIDNNGTDPFGDFGHAVWAPTMLVSFRNPIEGEKVTW